VTLLSSPVRAQELAGFLVPDEGAHSHSMIAMAIRTDDPGHVSLGMTLGEEFAHVVGGQRGPGSRGGLGEFRSFPDGKLATFHDGKGGVVHLLDADKPRYRRRYCLIAEDVAQSQTRYLVILRKVRAVGRSVTLEQGITGERFDAEPTESYFLSVAHSPDSSVTSLLLAVYGVRITSYSIEDLPECQEDV